VFRIYDNCLAKGIEAIFGFSVVLLHKNEEALLALKFDEILAFLNTRLLERYKVSYKPDLSYLFTSLKLCWLQLETPGKKDTYNVNEFLQDTLSLRITPFMLDNYAREYAELVRARDAHAHEVDALRNNNRSLSAQVWVMFAVVFVSFTHFGMDHRKMLETNMAQLNTEHVEVLVCALAPRWYLEGDVWLVT
jgi:ecotropic viral integration site 5 protein